LNTRASYIKILLTLLTVVWFVGIFSNTLLINSFGPASKISPSGQNDSFPLATTFFFTDKIYSLVCHQDAAKSFFFAGNKLEVCARCTGIYTGAVLFSIAALFFSRLRPRDKKWLLYSMIPMAADVILYSAGVYPYSKWIAFSTGLILGSISILYIFTGIEEYFFELKLSSNAQ
jgi:uncharacterized membrane protein